MDILNTYIENIILFNETLELSAEKNILTIIDTPRTPQGAHKPNLIMNTLVSGIMGFFVSVILIFCLRLFNNLNLRKYNQ